VTRTHREVRAEWGTRNAVVIVSRYGPLAPSARFSFDEIRGWELLDSREGKDVAVEIREDYIRDFSELKSHDPYQKEF
jgi:hypothetical protein